MSGAPILCGANNLGMSSTGLVAIGRCGSWAIDLDESFDGPQKWFTQIEGPSSYLYFEIGELQAIQDLIDLLERPAAISASGGVSHEESIANPDLAMGKFGGQPVIWLRDAEYADRLFILIRGAAQSVIRITIAGREFTEFLDALRQVRDGIQQEGLISSRSQ